MKKTNNMSIEEFWDKKNSSEKMKKIIFSVSFAVFCVFVAVYMIIMYNRAHSLTYLKFKINPEFVFVVNGNDEVVRFWPLNEDAYELYTEDMFVGKNYNDALAYAIDYAKEKEIIKDGEEKTIAVTVIGEKDSNVKEYEEKVVETIKKKDENLAADVVKPSKEEKEEYTKMEFETVMENKPLCCSTPPRKTCYVKPVTTDFNGADRYETAINVSKKLYPNGSKNVVLVNATGIEEAAVPVDGYISTNLAYLLNAPVLLTKPDKIKDSTIDEIKRLGANKVYVLGGGNVVSEDIINTLKNTLRVEVERIFGINEIITSIEVAKKIDSIKQINAIMLAPSPEFVDASFAGSVSAKENMPILYSKKESLDLNVKSYIVSNKNIKKIYLIGGLFKENVINDLKALGKEVEIISGEDRFKTNAALVNKFYKSFDSIVTVNNNIDLAVASSYSAKMNAPLLYIWDDNLWKAADQQQWNTFLFNKVINNIYDFMTDEYPLINSKGVNTNVQVSNAYLGNCEEPMDVLFTNKKAIFYVPHQDDETLYYGQLITAAIDELGADNVHLVLFSDGAGSFVNKQGLVTDLLKEQNITFSKARDREFLAAIKELGVKNYTFVEDLDFIDNRFADQGLKDNVSKVKEVMRYYDNLFNHDVTHFGYSYYDDHTDHNTIGKALYDLYWFSNDVKEFSDVLLIGKFDNIDLLDKNKNYMFYGNYMKIMDNKNYDKLLKASSKYKEDLNNGLIGIGYKSVGSVFDNFEKMIEEDKLFTPVHIPW